MARQRRVEQSGPLAGHVKEGRRYLSQLAATGVLQLGDWVRDDLPDLIWPALVLADAGRDGAIRFARWQQAVHRDLVDQVSASALADGLDGRLTSLESLGTAIPQAKQAARSRALELELLPPALVQAITSYPELPASWLFDAESEPPTRAEIDLLAHGVLNAMKDDHHEALLKCLPIWSAVAAGTFRTGPDFVELLKYYPNDPNTRSSADVSIRAAWGASKGAELLRDPSRFDSAVRWAKVFWGINSMTTRCLRARDSDDQHAEAPPIELLDDSDPAPPSTVPPEAANFRRFAMDLTASFVEALETSPMRLYDPERQEVTSGLVMRAGRDVIAALGFPEIWSMEHGAHIGRMLVEVRILIEWMALQDPSIYKKYQDYGAGKAKLYAGIAGEIPQDYFSRDVGEAVEELSRLTHNDSIIDHRVVDTSDSFAGVSLRQMAENTDLMDLYRHAYYLASGVTHSEWWSIETHAMERCLNVLHRGHLIPSLSMSAGANVELAESWIQSLHKLIWISLDILNAESSSVDSAFAWLTLHADEGDGSTVDSSNN